MATLPWGFSPLQALKQVGDAVNPFNGATNYDVFSEAGNSTTTDSAGNFSGTSGASGSWEPQVLGATTDPYAGAIYYDPTTGAGMQYDGNGQYSEVGGSVLNSGITPTGSGSGASSYDPADLAFVDTRASLIDQMLAGLEAKKQQGFGNIDNVYQSNRNRAQEQRDRAIDQYQTQRGDTIKGRETSLGKVDQYAKSLADSVRRRIGMASGSNSSAYKFAAPNAVARDASGKRTDVMETAGYNLRNLDKSEKYANSDFLSLLQSYEDQKRDQQRQFETGIGEQRQQLDLQRGELAGERARLTGAGYDGIRTAQQPYIDKYSQTDSALNSLFEKYRNPVFQSRDVNTPTPTLRDYLVDRTAVNANRQTGDNSPYAPYSNFLKKDEEQNLGY